MVSDVASVVTFILLFTKSSFNKSALVLLVTSVDNPVVNVETLLVNTTSAAPLVVASDAKFDVNVPSAVVALFTSAVKAVLAADVLAST